MTAKARTIDISHAPELLRIAEEVRTTDAPSVLERDGEAIAVLMPLHRQRVKARKGRPTSEDDPLWGIVGMADSGVPGDISENVDKYLAEAQTIKRSPSLMRRVSLSWNAWASM